MINADRYYLEFAAAFVRGKAIDDHTISIPDDLRNALLSELEPPQLETLFEIGQQAGLRLHKFKRTMGLPRITRVFGYLQAVTPRTLLDIGSGRGVFLWPLLDSFPDLRVTAVDRLEHRVADLQAVNAGGLEQLTVCCADATELPFDTNSVDTITMLEVLEHIPDPQQALNESLRVAQRFVIVSVPSKPDDNPDHIHLFDVPKLGHMMRNAGARSVSTEYVRGHIVVLAGAPKK